MPASLDDDWEEWNGTDPFWVHAVAGSFAGVAEHTAMFPVDTIKTYVQAERAGGVERLRASVRAEGVSRLWRGATSMLYGCAPAHAAYFSIYERGKLALGADGPDHAPVQAAAVGALATLAHDAIMTPADLIKQRLQLGFHASVSDALRTVVRTDGFLSLYRSYPTVLAMNIPFASVSVSVNESMRRFLNPSGEYHAGVSLVSGFVAGGIAGVITTPFDVVRTRLQTQKLVVGHVGAEVPHAQVQVQPQAQAQVHVEGNGQGPAKTIEGVARRRHASPAYSHVARKIASRVASASVAALGHSLVHAPRASSHAGGAGSGGSFVGSPFGGLQAQAARPKYTRPVRCPLPISMWVNPGTTTVASAAKPAATATASATAAVVSSVIRSRATAQAHAQAQAHAHAQAASPSSSAFMGPLQVARAVWTREGPLGFLRGAQQRFFVQAPAVAISWTAYETAKSVLLTAASDAGPHA